MEAKLDLVTVTCAICVAAYAAIAMEYVAQYGLGISLQQIRDASILLAGVIGTLIAIDFFGKKLRKAK